MLKIQKNISCSKRKNILHDDTDLGVLGTCLWLHNQSLEWWPHLAANGSLSTSQSFIKARIILWQNRKHDTSGLLKLVQAGAALSVTGELHWESLEQKGKAALLCAVPMKTRLQEQSCSTGTAALPPWSKQPYHTTHLIVIQPDQLHFLKTELVK